MNKLKYKVLFTIFGIFSIFMITILVVFNIETYEREKEKVTSSLKMNQYKGNKNSDQNIRFIDSNVYTVLIDEDNNVIQIISHTKDNTVNEDINNEIERMLENGNVTYIGNLYTDKYSYRVKNNTLTIVDNTNTNNILIQTFKISVLLLLLVEIVSYIISLILSNWIIEPVVDSFEKQKQFIADASHELKTPLAVIMASTDAYKKDNDVKWLNNIQNESDRMNKLITNLLDLSRVENNNIKDNINLSKLVEKSILTLESLMFEKNIKLDYDIKENIMFNCNSDEIKQLMSILLDNAIKHSCEKGNIKVNLKSDKSYITLEVINKGDKIPEGEEDKIFERFYRVDKSRNRNDNRYGLGLAIAKSITVKHNGIIKAYSKDKYTTFKVVFKNK